MFEKDNLPEMMKFNSDTLKLKKEIHFYCNNEKSAKFLVVCPEAVVLTSEKRIQGPVNPETGKQKSSFPMTLKDQRLKPHTSSPFLSKEKVIEDIFNYQFEIERLENQAEVRQSDPKQAKLAAEIKILDEDIDNFKQILKSVKEELDEQIARRNEVFTDQHKDIEFIRAGAMIRKDSY